jgi:hypothetical protein
VRGIAIALRGVARKITHLDACIVLMPGRNALPRVFLDGITLMKIDGADTGSAVSAATPHL